MLQPLKNFRTRPPEKEGEEKSNWKWDCGVSDREQGRRKTPRGPIGNGDHDL
jgi:hypothetical protein